ncbi:MAG: helix-turn-helix transcriptional regulator [Gemmataceae bacterium]
MSSVTVPPESAASVLLDVQAVARLLNCSTRHVYRLSDMGKMPAPVRVGALVRWQRQAIEEWVAGGCKPVQPEGQG